MKNNEDPLGQQISALHQILEKQNQQALPLSSYKHPLGIAGDSLEYRTIRNLCLEIKGVEGLVLEIGTRLGGGILSAMQACVDNDDKNRYFIGIDPYGGIEYKHGENSVPAREGHQVDPETRYNRSMMNSFLSSIYKYCYENDLHYCHHTLEDSEFMRLFEDGVIIYDKHKQLINKYALIIFDGPHDLESVKAETLFFKDRVSSGGVLIYDDVKDYDHRVIDEMLLEENFTREISQKRKIGYKKK